MTEITYSGMWLAAIFGSILYEHRRLKKEEYQLRETLKQLAAQTRREAEAPAAAQAETPAGETVKSPSC